MNDPRRPRPSDPAEEGPDPTQPRDLPYPPHTDPAYAGQAPYGSDYGAGHFPSSTSAPTESNTGEDLPQYWQRDQSPPGEPPEVQSAPPGGPKSPRWLWIAAGAAVLLVVALVIALVISNGLTKKQTAVPPLPAMPGPSSSARGSTATTSPSPGSTTATSPTQTSGGAVMQTVAYNVTGEGRAISITYEDSGGVKQTEFNVVLPWSKEVSLSAQETASVTIVNIGHDVTCSVTVAGVQVRQQTGAGLTVCSAAG